MRQPRASAVLGAAGAALVAAILAFVLLPAVVVTMAAFNGRAILSFPPETWSWRWFAKAIAYDDFRDGFGNGLIVTAWASSIALLVGSAFAFALDRYEFPLKRGIESVLLAPLVIPHFTVGLGFLILAAQLGASRGFAVVVACHVVLVLPFVLRSVYISLRNLDQRLELAGARAEDRDHAAPRTRARKRLALRGDPLLQRVHRITVRHSAAHPDPAGRHVQLRARIRRPLHGCGLGDVHRQHGDPADPRQRVPRARE